MRISFRVSLEGGLAEAFSLKRQLEGLGIRWLDYRRAKRRDFEEGRFCFDGLVECEGWRQMDEAVEAISRSGDLICMREGSESLELASGGRDGLPVSKTEEIPGI